MPTASEDCLFCKIVAGELPATIVDEDERTLAFMDINPATRGHALVIPRGHATDLHEIDAEDLQACALAAQRLAGRMRERLGADGINVINSCGAAAWQTVFHFHLHVVPRYVGDPLELPWVPAPGDMDEIAATGGSLRALPRRPRDARYLQPAHRILLAFPDRSSTARWNPPATGRQLLLGGRNGNGNGEVVQRRQGLRLHHAR